MEIYILVIRRAKLFKSSCAKCKSSLLGEFADSLRLVKMREPLYAAPPQGHKPLAMLLADLGVTKTHSRPRVSNDNPYSESQFKTMKYRPDFPDVFGSKEDARSWVRPFFDWYNQEHYHSSLGLLTPATVHYGQAAALLEKRQRVLDAAYTAHPE